MLKKSAKKRESKHRFNIAIPESLFRRVQIMATQNHRSVTGQILSAIEWSVREIKDEPVKHV